MGDSCGAVVINQHQFIGAQSKSGTSTKLHSADACWLIILQDRHPLEGLISKVAFSGFEGLLKCIYVECGSKSVKMEERLFLGGDRRSYNWQGGKLS